MFYIQIGNEKTTGSKRYQIKFQ